jgi:hypothetical protein
MAARSPLKAVLDIRREELPFALLMFAYFFLVTGSFWVLKPIKKALFLEMYDPGGFQLLGLTLTGAQAEQLAYPNGDTPRVISRGDGSIPEGIVIMKGENGDRMFIRDRFRLREYFPATGTYKALAHATFDSFIEDRPRAYDLDRITWRDSVKGYVNLRWMRSLHAAGRDKLIMAGGITDNQPGRVMVFDLKQNEPIRLEKGFKTTTADAIITPIVTGLHAPIGVALDRKKGRLFYTDVITASQSGGIWEAELDGSNARQIATTSLPLGLCFVP